MYCWFAGHAPPINIMHIMCCYKYQLQQAYVATSKANGGNLQQWYFAFAVGSAVIIRAVAFKCHGQVAA